MHEIVLIKCVHTGELLQIDPLDGCIYGCPLFPGVWEDFCPVLVGDNPHCNEV